MYAARVQSALFTTGSTVSRDDMPSKVVSAMKESQLQPDENLS